MKKTLMACQVKEKKGQVKDRKKRGGVNAIQEKNRRCRRGGTPQKKSWRRPRLETMTQGRNEKQTMDKA